MKPEQQLDAALQEMRQISNRGFWWSVVRFVILMAVLGFYMWWKL
jgi:hypothetical protein